MPIRQMGILFLCGNLRITKTPPYLMKCYYRDEMSAIDPLDLCCGKQSRETFWDSPCQDARMAFGMFGDVAQYLGEGFDIHGGSDLIFPHHENEIAQAEAVPVLCPLPAIDPQRLCDC